MQPEGSLPSPQQPSTCLYPTPHQSCPRHPTPLYLYNTSFKNILSSKSTSSQCPLSFRHHHQTSVISSATCPAYLNLHDFITPIMSGEGHKSRSSLLRHFFHPPVTPSFRGQTNPLSTLLSNILALCSSHNVTDQVSYPYKTTRSYSDNCYCNGHPDAHRGATMLRS